MLFGLDLRRFPFVQALILQVVLRILSQKVADILLADCARVVPDR